MKKVILKRPDTSVRLSGSVIKFLTPVSPKLELTDEEYLEYEGQLLWLVREGIVEVVDIVQEKQEDVVEEGKVEGRKRKRKAEE